MTEGNTAKIRRFYDRVGPWFYAFFFTLVGYRASLRHFFRFNHWRLGLQRESRILDAGIGTGFSTVHLLREAPVDLKVAGLDFSVGMIAGLRRWLRRLALEDRVRLQLGDIREMPFHSGSFDLVMSSAAMEYLTDAEEGIAECGRVLRPGGRLLIITTRPSLMGKLVAVLWRNRVLEPVRMKESMERAGVKSVQRLRFPWYFGHVNWWGMILLGEKAEGQDLQNSSLPSRNR